MDELCVNCKYFYTFSDIKSFPNNAHGECRRFPIAFAGSVENKYDPNFGGGTYAQASYRFPDTMGSYWCGEFKVKE